MDMTPDQQAHLDYEAGLRLKALRERYLAEIKEPPCCKHSYVEKTTAFFGLAYLSGHDPRTWGTDD